MEDVERKRVKERELKIEEILSKARGLETSVTKIEVAEEGKSVNFPVPQDPRPETSPTPENSAPKTAGTELANSKSRAIQDVELLKPEEQRQYLASLLVKANTAALETMIQAAKEGATAEEMKDYASATATMMDALLAAQWNQVLLDKAREKGSIEDIQQGPQVGSRLVASLHGKARRAAKMEKGDGRETPNKLRSEVLGPQDD